MMTDYDLTSLRAVTLAALFLVAVLAVTAGFMLKRMLLGS